MFIDCHLHTVRRAGLPRPSGDNFATPTELIAMMDRTGVDKGILLPGASPECADQSGSTEDILEVCEQFPDRFIPFCNIDPRAETNRATADLTRQIEYYKGRGCKGLGEVTANLSFTDPLVLNLLAHCQACRVPVVFHVATQFGGTYGLVDDLNLPGLERCLKLFPDLTFMGHSQAFWSEVDGASTTRPGAAIPPARSSPTAPCRV